MVVIVYGNCCGKDVVGLFVILVYVCGIILCLYGVGYCVYEWRVMLWWELVYWYRFSFVVIFVIEVVVVFKFVKVV